MSELRQTTAGTNLKPQKKTCKAERLLSPLPSQKAECKTKKKKGSKLACLAVLDKIKHVAKRCGSASKRLKEPSHARAH